MLGNGQISRPAAIGQKTILANADEAARQDVLGEAPQEFGDAQGHLALFAAMGIVLPAEGDVLAVKRQKPMIADGNPMCVAAEITKHLSWPAESWLGIDYPVLSEYGAQKRCELFGDRQTGDPAMEAEFLLPISSPQPRHKLSAKHATEYFHWQEEGIPGIHPAGVIG